MKVCPKVFNIASNTILCLSINFLTGFLVKLLILQLLIWPQTFSCLWMLSLAANRMGLTHLTIATLLNVFYPWWACVLPTESLWTLSLTTPLSYFFSVSETFTYVCTEPVFRGCGLSMSGCLSWCYMAPSGFKILSPSSSLPQLDLLTHWSTDPVCQSSLSSC